MKPIEIKGVDRVVRNLLRTKKKIGRGVERGFLRSANFIMTESLKIVPVQIGHLKGSWKINKHGTGLKCVVEFGYFMGENKGIQAGKKDAMYAVHVHEISPTELHRPTHGAEFNIKHAAEIAAAKGTRLGTAEGGMFARKPEEQYKFLERPIRENTDKILRTIRDEVAKVK